MCNKYIVTCKNPTQDIFVLSHDTNNALNERGRRCEHKRHNRSLRSKQPQPHLGQGYGHHREQGTRRKDHGKGRWESEHRDLAGEGDLRGRQPLHRLWCPVERQSNKKGNDGRQRGYEDRNASFLIQAHIQRILEQRQYRAVHAIRQTSSQDTKALTYT